MKILLFLLIIKSFLISFERKISDCQWVEAYHLDMTTPVAMDLWGEVCGDRGCLYFLWGIAPSTGQDFRCQGSPRETCIKNVSTSYMLSFMWKELEFPSNHNQRPLQCFREELMINSTPEGWRYKQSCYHFQSLQRFCSHTKLLVVTASCD